MPRRRVSIPHLDCRRANEYILVGNRGRIEPSARDVDEAVSRYRYGVDREVDRELVTGLSGHAGSLSRKRGPGNARGHRAQGHVAHHAVAIRNDGN